MLPLTILAFLVGVDNLSLCETVCLSLVNGEEARFRWTMVRLGKILRIPRDDNYSQDVFYSFKAHNSSGIVCSKTVSFYSYSLLRKTGLYG